MTSAWMAGVKKGGFFRLAQTAALTSMIYG